MTIRVTTVEIRGRDFEVFVSQSGEFFANYDEGQIKAPSLEELRGRLMKATKAIKVNVPFVVWKDGKIRRGTCTGKHATNRNYLVRWNGEAKAEQVASWDFNNSVDPAHADEFERLCNAAAAATEAAQTFANAHRIDVRFLADQAIEKAGAGEESAT